MPDSVRSRYERRLIALRTQLQEEEHPYPLGAILVSVGAITDGQLNQALASQGATTPRKLLGEMLVDLGCIDTRVLAHALSIQRSETEAEFPGFTNQPK